MCRGGTDGRLAVRGIRLGRRMRRRRSVTRRRLLWDGLLWDRLLRGRLTLVRRRRRRGGRGRGLSGGGSLRPRTWRRRVVLHDSVFAQALERRLQVHLGSRARRVDRRAEAPSGRARRWGGASRSLCERRNRRARGHCPPRGCLGRRGRRRRALSGQGVRACREPRAVRVPGKPLARRGRLSRNPGLGVGEQRVDLGLDLARVLCAPRRGGMLDRRDHGLETLRRLREELAHLRLNLLVDRAGGHRASTRTLRPLTESLLHEFDLPAMPKRIERRWRRVGVRGVGGHRVEWIGRARGGPTSLSGIRSLGLNC